MNAAHILYFNGERFGHKEIANQTAIPKSTVSRAIASLIEKGRLIEVPGKRDRRRRWLTLSPAHIAQLDAVGDDAPTAPSLTLALNSLRQ